MDATGAATGADGSAGTGSGSAAAVAGDAMMIGGGGRTCTVLGGGVSATGGAGGTSMLAGTLAGTGMYSVEVINVSIMDPTRIAIATTTTTISTVRHTEPSSCCIWFDTLFFRRAGSAG
jgi:hypothetical protein